MVSEASWQTGGLSGRGATPSVEGPMDQQSVETLLRRLVQRVEESERRYSEALRDLHARLDQLSQTTGAARSSGAFEDAETFDRLHNQVSSLARRLEQEASTPLDDFERLGRALSGELNAAAELAGMSTKPDLLSELAASSYRPSAPATHSSPFAYAPLEQDFTAPQPASPVPSEDRDLDRRLVEMAHRLEHSITTALPATALEALNARLDEISRQIADALDKGGKDISLDPVEHKLSDMAEQLGRAEAELAKIGKIETVLNQLIERVDGSAARMEEVAVKAASDAAQRVAEEAKLSSGTVERLDSMHRDLMAMSERSRANDDRLAGTIEAVHESLKKLVQLVEQNAAAAVAPKPRVPFAERVRRLDPQEASAETPEKAPAVMGASLRNRLAAAIPDFQDSEAAPNFGRAKRAPLEEKAPQPKESTKSRPLAKTEDASFEVPDDLVAAARRAAQAAALKVEERSGTRPRKLPGDGEAQAIAGTSGKRGRSFLIIFAAVLLAVSALLLYSRLRTKPEPVVMPPAAEQSAPLPPAATDESAAPDTDEGASAPAEPITETPPEGSTWAPEVKPNIDGDAVGKMGEPGNFTDVAKSSYQPASANETIPAAQPAALKPIEAPALPPGVVFTIEQPGPGQPAPALSPLPQSLPLPPEELGPAPLRQAAAEGDPRAQYAIALSYAQGQGTPQNLAEAARWLERAASAGLAPAQYRLGAMYERGQGVAKDLGRARSWYQAAAEKGNVKAMHNLAVSLSGRESGAPDYQAAAKWYAEAAAYGLADSQFNLGILAEHGLGMPKDLPRAYQWFTLAAKAGDAEAAKRSAQTKPRLDPAARAEVEMQVAAWTPKQALVEANEVVQPAEWADASAAAGASLVTRAQTLLNHLGYDVGTPDGLMGARTREAIKSFERKNGLEETGKVTAPLVSKLERLAG
jgi:localization factor PodJL